MKKDKIFKIRDLIISIFLVAVGLTNFLWEIGYMNALGTLTCIIGILGILFYFEIIKFGG